MNKNTWIVIVIIVVVLGGLYLLSMKSASAPATTATTNAPYTSVEANNAAGQANTGQKTNTTSVLKVSSSAKLGSFQVAENGMTLYKFTKDAKDVSNCYDACATKWPPYIVSLKDSLMASDGITGKIATITRTDGSTQLTYNGAPLYFHILDTKPGDTTGQNVGGIWFVVKP